MNSPKLTNILLIIIGILLAIAIFVFYQSWEQSHVTSRDYDRTDFRDQQNPQPFNQQQGAPVTTTSTNTTQVSNPGQVQLDLSSNIAQTYKTILSKALTQPANFNGHYVITTVGCGSGCMHYIGVDKNTGQAFDGPSEDMGMYGGLPGEQQNFSVESNILKVVAYDQIAVYQFNASRGFVLTQKTPYPRQ